MTRTAPQAFPPLADLTVPRSRRTVLAGVIGDQRGAATAEYAIATMATLARFGHVFTPLIGAPAPPSLVSTLWPTIPRGLTKNSFSLWT